MENLIAWTMLLFSYTLTDAGMMAELQNVRCSFCARVGGSEKKETKTRGYVYRYLRQGNHRFKHFQRMNDNHDGNWAQVLNERDDFDVSQDGKLWFHLLGLRCIGNYPSVPPL